MPAFERQSPHYLWDALPELFVRIDAIEPPPMDYEGLDRVRMVSVLHAIVSRTALPPVEMASSRLLVSLERCQSSSDRLVAFPLKDRLGSINAAI